MYYHYQFFETDPRDSEKVIPVAHVTTEEPLLGLESGTDFALERDATRGGETVAAVTKYRILEVVYGARVAGRNSYQIARVHLSHQADLQPLPVPRE